MTITEFQQASLDQLSSASGVDRSRWSKYLSGKIAPNTRTLEKIAIGLEMTIDELVLAMKLRQQNRRRCLKRQVVVT